MQRAPSFQFALTIMLLLTVLAARSAQAQTYTVRWLYSFQGGTDGSNPNLGLVLDTQGNGNLYGTTSNGGDPACKGPDGGCGTVFKVDPIGNETVLYRFTGGTDGGNGSDEPLGVGLVQDAQGNLYGTTLQGGALACGSGYGCGTVFELMPSGWGWTEK